MKPLLTILLAMSLASLTAPAGSYACHKQGGATHQDCGGGGGGGGEDPIESNPEIAYVRQDGRNAGIYVANADGLDERLVIQNTRDVNYANPSWSPDGEALVFGGSDAGIYVMEMVISVDPDDPDGTRQWFGEWGPPLLIARRTEWGEAEPAWHPDGDIIAYTDQIDSNRSSIFIVNADGNSSPVPIVDVDGAFYTDIEWSPLGDQFAVERFYPGISDVEVFDFNIANNPMAAFTTSLIPSSSPITAVGCPLFNPCLTVVGLGWAKNVPNGLPDLIAVSINHSLPDPETRSIWCIEVDNPGAAVDLSSDWLTELTRPDWSPDSMEIVAQRRVDEPKVKGRGGGFNSSLEVLELEYVEGGCPTTIGTRTLLDPPVGDYIGNAKWRP